MEGGATEGGQRGEKRRKVCAWRGAPGGMQRTGMQTWSNKPKGSALKATQEDPVDFWF